MSDLTPAAIMAAGFKRIKSIQDRYGINSQEVLDACIRWGGILDDVNYPDTTCRNCGDSVTYDSSRERYIHSNVPAARHTVIHCRRAAGAVAQPRTLGDWAKIKEAAMKLPNPRIDLEPKVALTQSEQEWLAGRTG